MEKSSAVALRALVAAVAGPPRVFDNRKSWLAYAARKAGISFRTVKAIFYGEIDNPEHPSVRLMRYAAAERAKALAERYESIARSMDVADPDFYCADVLGLIDAARVLRGLDLPGDNPAGAAPGDKKIGGKRLDEES